MQFNNVDIIILIITLISTLIALNRGFIKEMFSITGWVLSVFALIYALPVINPYMQEWIEGDIMAMVVSGFIILIVFFIVWIYVTSYFIDKLRSSKLSGMDRILGMFFGLLRAFLLVILFYIMVNWTMTEKEQPDTLWDSKLYQFAGKFADSIEGVVPQKTRDAISRKTSIIIKSGESDDGMEELFEQLSQPRIEKRKSTTPPPEVANYLESQQKDLDRLFEIISVDE